MAAGERGGPHPDGVTPMSHLAPHQTSTEFEKDFARLTELIADIKIAMLTTRDEDGTLRSRPMGTQSAEEFDGHLYFFTDSDSAKVFELEDSDREVNVAYAHPGNQKYASLSGTARLSRDRALMEKHFNAGVKLWYPEGLEDPKIALLIVDVVKAEYWDSPSKPAMLMAMAQAAISGERIDAGRDRQLDLQRSTTREAVRH